MNRHAIDFLRAPTPPRVGWGLLGLGISVLAVALWCDADWAGKRAAVLQAEQQALMHQRTLNTPPPPAEPSLAQRRWLQARVELNRPWLPALRAIESATQDPVYLLSLSIEPSTGQITLDAEASSFDQALDYVQDLGKGGALQQVLLTSHEQLVPAVGARPTVKFSAMTRWTPAGSTQP